MLKRTLISLAISLGLASAAQAELRINPIPANDLAREPNIQSVSMSAEGDLIVALIASPGSNNEETALATWDVNNLTTPPVVTPSGDRMKFIFAQALKADRILAVGRQEWTGQLGGCGEGRTVGATATFVNQVYLTDGAQSDFEEAFASNRRNLGVSNDMERCLQLAGTASVAADLPLDPDHVIIRRLNAMTLSSSYLRYNLRTDQTEMMYRANGRASIALFDPRNGDILVRSEIEPIEGDDYLAKTLIINPATGEFEEQEPLTYHLRSRHTVEVVGRDEASGQYYVITDQFSDLAQVYAYDPQTRRYSDGPILAHPRFSVTGLILGRKPGNFNQVLGFQYGGANGNEVYWVDPTMAATQQTLDGLFPSARVQMLDYTDGLGTILFQVSSGATPASYYVFRDGQLTLLGNSRPWIDPNDLRDTELVYYTARDGLRIPGLLSLPAGWEPSDGPLPTIIHPHGGPWARDGAGWDASGWTQFLTSRGYAVLRPQYRGSAGWGLNLWRAGDAQWGLAMQDDKDDGAAWLVSEGIADPDRIAIFGYSYGGFAAIAATVRDNSPYQCAIAGAGVSDLARIGGNWSENPLQRAVQGWTVRGMDPMENTEHANIPILLFHGDRDVRVPLFHSTGFYNAVRGRVNAELLVIEDQPHSLPWYPRQQRESLTTIERYLAEDCGPGGL
ncbi:alpha/beta hydrolase family protein [Maricaulis sp.]|uniref:alpha/beta hydrolase family protein n=1 Tax=Maricaulis sp. TaxID=1486257 RepID=UPI003A955881